MKKTSSPSFEKSFARLEKILQTMQQGEIALEESLKLYEEANQLMKNCSDTLDEAEQKIQKLMKADGQLVTDENGDPLTEEFAPDNSPIVNRESTNDTC